MAVGYLPPVDDRTTAGLPLLLHLVPEQEVPQVRVFPENFRIAVTSPV